MEINIQSAAEDEYYITAQHIFDYCGADSTGFIRVDDLMEKFTPFVKTDRAEFKHLKSFLDPTEENRNINVSSLAEALAKYSESQKVKVDLDESFNLKGCQGPLDSDSGISSDGFQLLEELQCELREKSHLAHQLRSQLDFTDRQHEEAISSLTAERDSLRAHLNMLREENVTLTHVKADYEETCDRLCASERALDEARRELEGARRRGKVLAEQVTDLESEKLTLQELLATSKAECHRINEMYSSRQATLLDEVETLRSERAVLAARLQDQEDYMHHTFKEKVLLEMELKDILNKSNQQHLRMDQSIDVSYTEEQMLTALDTLNADSRFSQDVASTSVQVDTPCGECAQRNAAEPSHPLRRYFWEPLKCLFQLFAVICFLCAISVLYGVTRKWHAKCLRDSVPWSWLNAHEIMDLFFRLEYVADVPM